MSTILDFPLTHPIQAKDKIVLRDIKHAAELLQLLPISTHVIPKVFHQQFLKSALFSARIEGNTLTLPEIVADQIPLTKQREKKELNNVFRLLQKIDHLPVPANTAELQELHRQILDGIDTQAGKLRHESSAIYDQFGNIVYLTPNPTEVQQMLTKLFAQLTPETNEIESLIKIAAAHYYFEKIHPFLDGNGRTGRVLLQIQLRQTHLFGKYILPIEEYFDNHRSDYYFYLEKSTRHIEGFTHFFLQGILSAIHQVITDIQQATETALAAPATSTSSSTANLLPRRQEILLILADHPNSSLDFIARRFPTLSPRTISQDLQWLGKQNLTAKQGTTRGTRYTRKAQSGVCTISCVNGGGRQPATVFSTHERVHDRYRTTGSQLGTNSGRLGWRQKFG